MRIVWRRRWRRSRGRGRTRLRKIFQLTVFGFQFSERAQPGLAVPRRTAHRGHREKMFSLKDKVAVVTGASQGIGRDTALALAEAGAKVAVAARNEDKLAALVKDIESAGGEAFAVKMDVAEAEQVKAGFKQVIEKFGRLDILVNNAAITRDGLAMRMKK